MARNYLGMLAGAACLAAAGAAQSATPDQIYLQRCLLCHQPKGIGLPGQYPRLAGRVAAIAQSAAGRRYLLQVLLNGMAGTVTIDGRTFSGLMPSMATLSDADIAAVLNQAVIFPPSPAKKPAPFTAGEVAAARKAGTVPASMVATNRAKLVAAKVIP